MHDKKPVKTIRKRGLGVSGNLALHARVSLWSKSSGRKCCVIFRIVLKRYVCVRALRKILVLWYFGSYLILKTENVVIGM